MENTYVLIKKPEWDILLPALKHVKLLPPMCTEVHIDKTIKERATEAASKYKWNDERDGKFYIECFIEGAKQQSVKYGMSIIEFAEWFHKGNFDFVNGLWYGDYSDKALTNTELIDKFTEHTNNKP